MSTRRPFSIATLATAVALVLVGCGGDGGDATAEGEGGGADEGPFTIGVSNTLVGNQWREQMVCSIQAQALASGVVDKVVLANRNTDASGQIADIEGLIGQGVDAIIVNPHDRTALDDVIAAADEQGIIVISVDQAVTAEAAYNVTNDQVAYAELGARWLFEQLGGSGDVVYMRGFEGNPADVARDEGFQAALADYPGINVVREVHTGWDPTTGAQQALEILSAAEVDGIWTSGIDYTVVEQFEAARHPYVPIVGADNNGFIEQLIELKDEGLIGAAVTNPPPVGGVATAIAVDLLTGAEEHPQDTLLTPEVHDNVEDLATLEELHLPDLPTGFVSTMELEPWTTYTQEDVLECRGPGD
ncbi:substrate-binding domain-containing protein [Jiangella gansuensis]|uniref:substrate-binding domain-containing protein n=1 Tax=Jiangella gansuensis TaxID=281473 RepID=UPI000479EA84|nr:substrate-binding domain-containing protein [Jiangella gansuensis]